MAWNFPLRKNNGSKFWIVSPIPSDGLLGQCLKEPWAVSITELNSELYPPHDDQDIVNPDKRLHNAVLCRVRMRATEIGESILIV